MGDMEGSAMTIALRTDYDAAGVRALAAASKNAHQSRRLLSIAAIYDGMNRTAAAKIGGMDRQTLRDWVHHFNADGPQGLIDHWAKGPTPKLSAAQTAEFAQIVDKGPDPAVDGVVRWRRADLQRLLAARFGVVFCERYVGTLLKQLGFSRISARPQHAAQDPQVVAAFKKTLPPPSKATPAIWQRQPRSRSGSRMKPALARRMA